MEQYKTAAYIRISKEQYDKKESNSITNQKLIINNYIECNKDLKLVDFYVDDGHTGTDFNRAGFKRLLQDIKSKKINTIIVKDLSRFGRNYIEVGNYLENIFCVLNVRFISILDNIDTLKDELSEVISIKNIINDYYSKDISNKVKSVLKSKKENGNFIGKSAPYGYLKDPNNKYKFIIDEESSKVVTKIFDMFLSGSKITDIVKYLNKKNILPPGLYKIKNNISNYKRTDDMNNWTTATVNRILKNRVYTGDLIQNKTSRINYRIHKIKNIDENEWIITYNHHEPIIDKEKFDKVQKILERKKGYYRSNDIFAGYLKCADCGNSMTLRKAKDKEYYYCTSYVRNGKCTNHSIRKDKLYDIVLDTIRIKYKDISEINLNVLLDLIDYIKINDNKTIDIIYKRN